MTTSVPKIGNVTAVTNVSGVDRKRNTVMMYHIALDITYDFGFVETCQTIQTEVRGDMPWHEAVEQEINNLKLDGLDYTVELRWVKEYADA
jgi:ABC-type glucose/galactose transport system permease subunit|tara:strand:+ start:215 stop:487 length:273 start_codon:yes stop_codon:yes gene_type:complete